ncbi:MAG: hypothetical protein IJT36_00865 [Alphaproteobacteria bacterium]|nr:hypothetical protein [Alphaproteobacteria bacterium]
MVQQLTNTRTNKQLTGSDLGRISYASCLNLFHNNTMFRPWPLGIYYIIVYQYVKRISSDNYTYQYVWTSTGNTSEVKTELLDGMNIDSQATLTKTESQVRQLNSDLVCQKDGDERLWIQVYYATSTLTNFTKSKLELFVLEPKFGTNGNFIYNLIITPKPGLFPVPKYRNH